MGISFVHCMIRRFGCVETLSRKTKVKKQMAAPSKSANLVIVLPCVQEADFLRVSLPRTKRVFPDAKIVVITTKTDLETIGVCVALKVHCLQVETDVLTSKGAKFNLAGVLKPGIDQVKSFFPQGAWVLLTRAQILLDDSFANLAWDELEKAGSLYGAGITNVATTSAAMTFKAVEPTPEEARQLVPTSYFALFHSSHCDLLPSFSHTSKELETDLTQKFQSIYIIQSKVGYLGEQGSDADGRVSARWDGRPIPTRVAPAHPNTQASATSKPTAAAPAPKTEAQNSKVATAKGFGVQSEDQPFGHGRKELDEQQFLKRPTGESWLEPAKSWGKPQSVNPWKAQAAMKLDD